jgi:flagellar basal body-associated protein FliL
MPQLQPVAVPLPAPPQIVPPKTGKGKVLVPLIILGGLLVLAVVVIVMFALKH